MSRRSARIRRNIQASQQLSQRNNISSQINGSPQRNNISSQRSNGSSQRVIPRNRSHNSNSNRSNRNNNNIYSGKKRRRPNDSDSDSDNDNESDTDMDNDNDSDYSEEDNNVLSELNNHNNYNGHNGHNGYHANGNSNSNSNSNSNGYHNHVNGFSQSQFTPLASQTQISQYSQLPVSPNENINNNNNNRNNGRGRVPPSKKRRLTFKNDRNKWTKNRTNQQRRTTRLGYRELADETHDKRAQIVDPMTGQFMDKLLTQNKLFDDVSHPNEAFMDIEQANTMASVLKEQTKTLQNEQFTITPNDLIKSIKDKYARNNNDNDDNNNNNNNNDPASQSSSQSSNDDDDNDNEPTQIDWASLGRDMAPWFLTVPAIQFMNGPLQQCEQPIELKKTVRQYRRKSDKNVTAPLAKPKKIVKQKKKDKTETKSRVKHLQKTLRKKCTQDDDNDNGVNPFPFLINPHSYSQTVENLFDMSFIMKEGYAQMCVDKYSKQPVLSFIPSSIRTQRFTKDKKTKTNGQCIVKFNPSTFNQLIDVYDITESQVDRADLKYKKKMKKNNNNNDTTSDEDDDDDDDESDEDEDESDEDESDDDYKPIKQQNKRKPRGKSKKRNKSSDKEEAD